MPPGRPLKYQSPEEMESAINAYFEKCEAGEGIEQVTRTGEVVTVHRKTPPTMAGLAYALDISRNVLNKYQSASHTEDQENSQISPISQAFCDIIARARRRIETDNVNMGFLGVYESRLNTLNLASNFGYSTKQEVEHSGKISLEDALRDLED